MVDKRVGKLANICVNYSVGVRQKEKVLIKGSHKALPLITEIYRECLQAGGYPFVLPDAGTYDSTFFRYAKDHQLEFVQPVERFLGENIDVRISIKCEANPKRLTSVPPSRIKKHRASQKELTETFYKRVGEGRLRWTLVAFPISAQAQEASMAIEEYEDFVYRSCLVEKKDPIGEWKKVQIRQDKICKMLDKARRIRITGEDTELTLKVEGRKWINCCGQRNMPDGEVFTAPTENSASGRIRFTYPGIYAGREVEDITLNFKKGKVVKANAAKGGDLLKELLKIEGANRIGEIAIGTNSGITRFTKDILFDEKMGGTLHMALGNSYPDSGGKNKSAIHWDMLKNMKQDAEIQIDGHTFYKNGKFLE